MATAIQFLRSSTPRLRPNPADLAPGMPMVNIAPEEPGLYFKTSDEQLIKIGPTFIGTVAPNDGATGHSGNAIGEQWLDVTTPDAPILKIWDGVTWQEVAGGGGSSEDQVQADFDETDSSEVSFIKNKPTKTSDFTNDGDGTKPFLRSGDLNAVYFPRLVDVPSATANHGAVAHAHDTGKQYYAHNGSWIELGRAQDIPENVSELTNDAGYITNASLPTNVSEFTNDASYITLSDIPSNVSEFTNDASYITLSDVPQSNWNEVNSSSKAFISNKPDLSLYQLKADVVQSDWSVVDDTSDAYIDNKPTKVSDFNVDIGVGALTDVSVSGVSDGQILVWNGTQWGNANQITLPPTAVIMGTADVASAAPGSPEVGHIYIQTGAQPSIADSSWTGIVGEAVNDGAYLIYADNSGSPQWFVGSNISAQVQSDWSSNDTNNPEFIRNKPDLTVYALKTEVAQSDWTEATTSAPSYIVNKPDLSVYALKTDIVQSDWNEATSSESSYILNKPDLSVYALKTEVAQADWNESTSSDPAYIANKPDLSVYATKGEDLQDLDSVLGKGNTSTETLTAGALISKEISDASSGTLSAPTGNVMPFDIDLLPALP